MVREASRVGSQVLDQDPVQAAIAHGESRVSQVWPLSGASTTVTAALIDDTHVRVQITLQFDPLVGFVPTPDLFTAASERVLESI